MRVHWHKRYMDMAKLVASWSKDPSSQVGAVIVNDKKIVVGMGYNGFARGVGDHDFMYKDRSIKYEVVIHAEINAILNATGSVENCIIYTTHPPCSRCTAVLIQSGLRGCMYDLQSDEFMERFAESLKLSNLQARDAGFSIMEYTGG